MANHLAHEISPYLRQHADNPVDWYPWGEEALERARREDKPIFLSIGYAACHWCHVMAHESFEDAETAAFMNEHFINIKVDREERPDLDGIYMSAVVAMTGQGGWPMSVFLTPEGQPFFGGTYFPPVRRYNIPSFKEVLTGVQSAWKKDRAGIVESGTKIAAYLEEISHPTPKEQPLSPELLEQAALRLAQAYDWKFGGWGQAPKFPQPMAIEFLLRRATRGDQLALDISLHALNSMALGGMYDIVGGGFARYSTDNYWRVPHFEKMLYDNAQLARVYLYGYLLSGQESLRLVCEKTLEFMLREMRHPSGGFFSSLDADSEGEEGKFYVWTPADIRQALQDDHLSELVIEAYGITQAGNFEGYNVLQRTQDDEHLSEQFGLTVNAVRERLRSAHARLLAYRNQRIRPATDDKILTSWNALAMIAFIEAGKYLRRQDFLSHAEVTAAFLLDALWDGKSLYRAWRDGKAAHLGFLEDYAGLSLALCLLYQADGDPRWFTAAEMLSGEMIDHFVDVSFGFFDTHENHETLITRPKDLQDNATPCGNSLAATALLQLAALNGNGSWRDIAEKSLSALQSDIARYPTAFGQWLCAVDFALGPMREVAIVGDEADVRTQALVAAVWQNFQPYTVVARSAMPLPPGAPLLLRGREQLNDQPTAYVCQRFVCQTPVNTPQALFAQLAGEA
jgi:uncharacterized protein YyaL (SSP411 family)